MKLGPDGVSPGFMWVGNWFYPWFHTGYLIVSDPIFMTFVGIIIIILLKIFLSSYVFFKYKI